MVKNICDVCGKEVQDLLLLYLKYRPAGVNEGCSNCLNKINAELKAVQDHHENLVVEEMQTFILRLKSSP